jgi:DNA polymerase family A
MPRRCTVCDHPGRHGIDEALVRAVSMPVAVETRTLTSRRRTDIQKVTDRLNAPVQGTATDGLKLALTLLWERRHECPGATPVLVCHDEVVVECDIAQAADVRARLEKAMVEGMEAVLNSTDEVGVPVEVEARTARCWGEGGQPYVQRQGLEESGPRRPQSGHSKTWKG